jgi:hypothetical protein
MVHPPLSSPGSASSIDSYEEPQELIAEILEIFGSLAAEADLQPRKAVNDKFGSLVNLCIKPRENCVVSAVLSDPSVQEIAPQLRELCSEGEANLETFWAHRIIDAISGSAQGGELRLAAAEHCLLCWQKRIFSTHFPITTTMSTCADWNMPT